MMRVVLVRFLEFLELGQVFGYLADRRGPRLGALTGPFLVFFTLSRSIRSNLNIFNFDDHQL